MQFLNDRFVCLPLHSFIQPTLSHAILVFRSPLWLSEHVEAAAEERSNCVCDMIKDNIKPSVLVDTTTFRPAMVGKARPTLPPADLQVTLQWNSGLFLLRTKDGCSRTDVYYTDIDSGRRSGAKGAALTPAEVTRAISVVSCHEASRPAPAVTAPEMGKAMAHLAPFPAGGSNVREHKEAFTWRENFFKLLVSTCTLILTHTHSHSHFLTLSHTP